MFELWFMDKLNRERHGLELRGNTKASPVGRGTYRITYKTASSSAEKAPEETFVVERKEFVEKRSNT